MTPVTSIGGGLPIDIRKMIGPPAELPADFKSLIGTGPTLATEDLRKAIQNDFGLSNDNKSNLFAILNSPNVAEQLLAGAAGGAIGLALARYKEMSGTAQTLMSLAGFGLGNIIMNSLTQPGKFTQWNPETATNRVKL